MAHPKLKKQYELPNNIEVAGIKYTFEFVDLYTALNTVGRPFMAVADRTGAEQASDIENPQDRLEYLQEELHTIDTVLHQQVTHLDDVEYKLEDEDLELIPILHKRLLFSAITKTDKETLERMRRFLVGNKKPETDAVDVDDLPEIESGGTSAVEAADSA